MKLTRELADSLIFLLRPTFSESTSEA